MERGEGADTPDSHHRLTPSQGPKTLHSNQTSFPTQSTVATPNHGARNEDAVPEDKIKLPLPSSSRLLPLPSINGEIGSEDSTLWVYDFSSHVNKWAFSLKCTDGNLTHMSISIDTEGFICGELLIHADGLKIVMFVHRVCARCGISFTGTWYDKQRKRPSCPTCWGTSVCEFAVSWFWRNKKKKNHGIHGGGVTVFLIPCCLFLFNSDSLKDKRTSDDSFSKGKASSVNSCILAMWTSQSISMLSRGRSSVTQYRIGPNVRLPWKKTFWKFQHTFTLVPCEILKRVLLEALSLIKVK